MVSEMVPLHVVEASGLEGLAAGTEEGLVILPGNKADLLTIFLVGNLESQLAGDIADLGFGELPEREE